MDDQMQRWCRSEGVAWYMWIASKSRLKKKEESKEKIIKGQTSKYFWYYILTGTKYILDPSMNLY
jgi:translation elongation factor EF-Ts